LDPPDKPNDRERSAEEGPEIRPPRRTFLQSGTAAALTAAAYRRAKDAALKLALDALGLTPKLVWQEFIGVQDLLKGEQDPAATLDFYGRMLTIRALPSRALRLVAVRKY
jgi:hypothetical protein